MTRRLALITTLFVLATAAPAAAQGGAFSPLPQAAPTETPTPTVVSSADSETDRSVLFVIGAVLVLGFGAMGWFIMRDARRAVPDAELAPAGALRDDRTHAQQKQAKRKSRAKGKSQRNARKHNRPR